MIEINLLPSGAARRAPARARRSVSLPSVGADPRVAGLGAVALLVLVFFAWDYMRTGAKRTELAAQVERAEADSARLARTIALMESLEGRRDTIEQKIEVIRQVDTRRYVWPHLMDEVSRAVPPYTWLTRIAAVDEPEPVAAAPADTARKGRRRGKKDDEKGDSAKAAAPVRAPEPVGPSFNVEGNAATTQALTRFMKNLEASPMVRDVALVTSEQTQTEGRTFLKFTLEARFEQADSTFVESVPVLTVQ
ncbi:MAG TPA: PilN domain-containing protein [Longimicrobium sp.]|nr:PilN domain-containing protein [Longimicrobium sp.]